MDASGETGMGDALKDDPLEVLGVIGWQMVWLPNVQDDVWVIDEARVVIADVSLSPRCVADVLWTEFCERLVS